MIELTKKRGLTIFDLKIIGIVFMFIDHIHQMFSIMGVPNWVDWFGRPVATLFFFVSVEGFSHTRNKKKYLARLLIGFWVMGFGTQFIQKYFELGNIALQNNIFSDLFIGVLAMYGIDLIRDYNRTKEIKYLVQSILSFLLPVVLSVAFVVLVSIGNPTSVLFSKLLPATLLSENTLMVYLAPILYLLKDKKSWQCMVIGIVSMLFFFRNPSAAFSSNIQWMMVFSIVPILLYNGDKGNSMKSFFYLFYPLHIWLLYIIASLVYNR